jgi:energy-coupling factor transport system ATP-binding protein
LEIRAEKLSHIFNAGTPLETDALKDVSFTLPSGKVLGVLGGTGSGKTTLIRHLNGLLAPSEGRLLLDGREVASYGAGAARAVGVVFQRPERQLFEQTVVADISFVLRRFSTLSEDDIFSRVWEYSRLLGLDMDEIAHRSPLSLSDGEKRRVAIAGVLVNDPGILVLDEPAVGLDPPSLVELVQVLEHIKIVGGRSIVIVSHDMEPFLALLDFLLVLDRGRVAAYGSPADVCAILGDDPVMRGYLPDLAMLVYHLRRQGVALLPDEFRIRSIADQLAGIALSEEDVS